MDNIIWTSKYKSGEKLQYKNINFIGVHHVERIDFPESYKSDETHIYLLMDNKNLTIASFPDIYMSVEYDKQILKFYLR